MDKKGFFALQNNIYGVGEDQPKERGITIEAASYAYKEIKNVNNVDFYPELEENLPWSDLPTAQPIDPKKHWVAMPKDHAKALGHLVDLARTQAKTGAYKETSEFSEELYREIFEVVK